MGKCSSRWPQLLSVVLLMPVKVSANLPELRELKSFDLQMADHNMCTARSEACRR
jgi:hypothetical protein